MSESVAAAATSSSSPPVHMHFAIEHEMEADGRCVSWLDRDPRKTKMYIAENDSFQTYILSKMNDTEVTRPYMETAIPRKTILDAAFSKLKNTACFLVTKPEEVDSDDSNSDRDDQTPVPYVLVEYNSKNKPVVKKELFRIQYAESLLAIHDNGDVLVYSEPEGKKPYVQVFDGTTFALKSTWPCKVRGAYRMYATPGMTSTCVLLASAKGIYYEDLAADKHVHVRRVKHIDDFTVLEDGRVVLGTDEHRLMLLSPDLQVVLREWSSNLSVDTSLNPEAADAESDDGTTDTGTDSDSDDELILDADDEDAGEEGGNVCALAAAEVTDSESSEKGEEDSDQYSLSTTATEDSDVDVEDVDVFKQIRDIFSSQHYVYVRFASDDVLVYNIADL